MIHGSTCLILLVLLLTCGRATAGELLVSAAVSMKNGLEHVGREFERLQPGAKVVFNFGASGDLARQIEAGAPVDVFFPAAAREMDDLEKQGLIMVETRTAVAANSVVLIVPAGEGRSIGSFLDLRRHTVKRVALGSPKSVPAGRYAEEVLQRAGLLDAVRPKAVYAENVRQVLDYVGRGEVDAGIVYRTDALAAAGRVRIAATAPPAGHTPVVYPAAVLTGAKHERLARLFVAFAASRDGRRILEGYGFSGAK